MALTLLGAVPALATGRPVTRPVEELFGEQPGYGFAGVGVATATGNYTRSATDVAVHGLLSWGRTYNSLDETDGALGRGWTTTYSARLTTNDDGSVLFQADDGRSLTFRATDAGEFLRPLDLLADLTENDDGGYTLRYLSGAVWTFDADGRGLRREIQGQHVVLTYDDDRLASIAHSAGYGLDLTYDGGGRIIQVTSNDGRAVTYGYSESGHLESVAGPGVTERFLTDPEGRITKVIDAEDRVAVANAYDDDDRVAHQDFGTGGAVDIRYDVAVALTTMTLAGSDAEVTFEHDSAGHLVRLRDPDGNALQQSFDGSGNLTALTSLGGLSVTYEYDGRGNVTSVAVDGAPRTFEYDALDRVVATTDPAGGVTTYQYAGTDRVPTAVTDPTGALRRFTVVDGLVVEAIDAMGASTRYTYDGKRRLTEVTNPNGDTTRYAYDAAGNRAGITTPLGHTTSYEYDATGRLVSRTDPTGATSRFRYTAAGSLLEVIDPTGAVTRNTYDANRRLASRTDPLDRTTTYSYDSDGNLATVTDPLGGVSRYTYDRLGRLETVTDPAGTQIRYAYDADGRQTERSEPAGTTATSYDRRGNVTATTDELGRVTRYKYDANDRLIEMTDPTGAVWRTEYDAAGRVTARTNPLGHTTRYGYDAAGRLVRVTNPLGHSVTYQYDPAGRLTRIIDALGGIAEFTYDADGNRTSEKSPAGLVSRYTYDDNGRRLTYTDPRGGVTRYEYNARGQEISVTSPSGAVHRAEYDAASQLVSATDPNGNTTRYAYNAAGHLTDITEPSGAVTHYEYDSAGRQVSVTDPLGRMTRQTYDTNGNLTTVTEPDGRVIELTYDAASQLVRRAATDTDAVSFAYDAAGRRTGMTDATGTTEYAYDAAGRLISLTEPDGRSLRFAYDAADRRAELRYPDGHAVTYVYDANDRLTGIVDPRAGASAYGLDPDGRLLTEDLPDGWTRSYSYTDGLLARYRETHGADTTQDSTLTRDADGRIVTVVGPSQDLTFGYDLAGALVTVTGQPGGDLTLEYDENGNRTGITRAGVASMLTYDAADQLVSIDTGPKRVTYTYDGSGRLLTRVGRDTALNVTYDSMTVTYDSLGRAVGKERSLGGVTRITEYTYNGDGLPVQIDTLRSPGNPPSLVASQRFTWDPASTVEQIVTGNDTNFTYGYGRVAATNSTDAAIFSRDVFGSTIRTSETAMWAQSNRYDVFGDPDNANQPAITIPGFGYRGELSDDDSVFLRARDYDTTVGRFSSRDPADVMVGQADPDSPYVYANNDPVNFMDPQGEFAVSDVIGRILALLQQVGGFGFDCDDDDPGNSIERHDKCFQGTGPLRTRGFISEDCLNANPNCLEGLYNSHQPERAAHALTLNELNKRREGFWRRFWDDQLGGGTGVSKDVDWEVGNTDSNFEIGFQGFRIDIVTNETNIYEVKRYTGPSTTSEVTGQLARYITTASTWYGIVFVPGTELAEWANGFVVYSNWFKRQFQFGETFVYVWGMGNPPGHVYFAEKDKVPANVVAAAEAKWHQEGANQPCNVCVPEIPIIIPIIRVPVPVV